MCSLTAALLLQPLDAGALELPNRILMAPMTRLRTLPDLSMQPIAATYYAQRASAGLIISEVLAVAPYGAGYGAMLALISHARKPQGRRSSMPSTGPQAALRPSSGIRDASAWRRSLP